MNDQALQLFEDPDRQPPVSAEELDAKVRHISEQPTKRLASDDKLSEAHADSTAIRPAWENALAGDLPNDEDAIATPTTRPHRPFEMPRREKSNTTQNLTPLQAQKGVTEAKIDSLDAETKAEVAAARAILHRELGK